MKRNLLASRRRALVVSATLACAAAAPLALAAEDKFPSNPIEVVIHSRYGGGTDTTARMMMIRSRRTLGVDMSVNAQRGGSGAQAHQYAMGKARDGYTVLALTQTLPLHHRARQVAAQDRRRGRRCAGDGRPDLHHRLGDKPV